MKFFCCQALSKTVFIINFQRPNQHSHCLSASIKVLYTGLGWAELNFHTNIASHYRLLTLHVIRIAKVRGNENHDMVSQPEEGKKRKKAHIYKHSLTHTIKPQNSIMNLCWVLTASFFLSLYLSVLVLLLNLSPQFLLICIIVIER